MGVKPAPAKSIAIPPEQLPMNEYQELRESAFFHWATLEPRRYALGLLLVWGMAWIVSGPVAAWSYPPLKLPFPFLLAGAAGAGIVLFLVVARLYLGWSYIYERLSRARVDYEETGAHDGNWWDKPAEEHARDQLVVQYQITPILLRLRRTLTAVSVLMGTNGLLWWLS
ncbi:CGLD27 family protein [Anthocerotibacter panamensis]|uniref:CGLD27 family protein n=1 Tax=Anthocerotibacter panamensis TaxID=2857077 RepID=UPI001C40675A|nr:CGLD27 family protein [Anthocerotibacter panamensis]